MLSLLDRINKRLLSEATEGPDEPTIIDISTQAGRNTALHNSRGPNVGWDDYLSGRDYQPPMYYTSSVPYGPAADPEINPHSEKYGGIRPWDPNEIAATIMYPMPYQDTTEGIPRSDVGLLWTIARTPKVINAYLMARGGGDIKPGTWPVPDAIALAAEGANRALANDKAVLNNRFTSFLGNSIPEAMRGGVPPGYHNEYRDVRGAINYIESIGRLAQARIRDGDEVDDIIDELQEIRQGVDLNPGAGNRSLIRTSRGTPKEASLGNLGHHLIDSIDELEGSILSNDVDRIKDTRHALEARNKEIEEEGLIKTSRGFKTGGGGAGIITMPKDIGMETQEYRRALDQLGEAEELLNQAWHLASSGGDYSNHPDYLMSLLTNTTGKKPMPVDFGEFGKASGDRPGVLEVVRHAAEAVASGDNESIRDAIIKVQIAREMIASTKRERPGVKSLTFGSDDDGGREVERSDIEERPSRALSPEDMEFVERAVRMLRTGMGRGTAWAGHKALDSIGKLQRIIEMLGSPPAQKKYKVVPSEAGFDVVDAKTADVVGRGYESEDEAAEHLTELQQSRLLNSVQAVKDEVTSEWGEYAQEIRDAAAQLGYSLQSDDARYSTTSVQEIADDLRDLEEVAHEDAMSGGEEEPLNQLQDLAFTQQEYMFILRRFGIKNYPERGTVDDPEIDEEGNLSDWARAGYPALESNSDIAKTMWVPHKGTMKQPSSARVSQIKKVAERKFGEVIKRMQAHLSESGQISMLEYQMLTEFRITLGWMFVEDVARNMPIFG